MSYAYGAKLVQANAVVAAATTDGILVSPATTNKVKVAAVYIHTSGAQTVTLESDDAAGDRVLLRAYLAANGGLSWVAPAGAFLGETEAGADLIWTTSGATDASITVVYTEDI